MTPSELCITAKCKWNISQKLQHLALVLYIEAQHNRGVRQDCKAITKKAKDYKNMIKKTGIFFLFTNAACFNLNERKSQKNEWFKIFVHNSLQATGLQL